jgi:hypothetical protein
MREGYTVTLLSGGKSCTPPQPVYFTWEEGEPGLEWTNDNEVDFGRATETYWADAGALFSEAGEWVRDFTIPRTLVEKGDRPHFTPRSISIEPFISVAKL